MKAGILKGGAPHVHRNGVDTGDCRCPWCRQTVSRDELIEIQVRQDELVAEIEEHVKTRLITERDAEIERVRQEAAAAVEAAQRAATKREATIRREAAAAAAASLAPKLAKAEQDRKTVEQQMKALRTNQETVIAERLVAQRETFEKAVAAAALAERAKYVGEKLALEGQLEDLKRRVQARTANQIGEPGEVDLYERLSAAFPDDRVSRVVKGVPGPDVLVEVVHNGEVVGKIALDSKVHARWQNKFTSKLRSDMLAEGADFAILSTSVFPKDAQQLHIQDGVIVADPARVPVLVHLLRSQIIDNHTLRLTTEARDEKADRLLDFIVSPGCRDLLDRIVKLTTDMANLDLKEADVHATTWKKRADLIRGIQNVHAEFAAAVSAIIAGEAE
jgi:hypothetical protein